VDINEGIITIRETKFHKSRLVPLDATVTKALRKYARFRDRYLVAPASRTFFVGEKGRHLSFSAVYWTFRRLCTVSGICCLGQKRNPRLYDLRHTFCTRRLLEWHRQHVDVEQAIPALSTYVGHVKVTDTYWYLSGIPELFAVTGAKFERYASRFQGGKS
jgi:integrase